MFKKWWYENYCGAELCNRRTFAKTKYTRSTYMIHSFSYLKNSRSFSGNSKPPEL